jgi:Fe-S-cluster-containing hydrogenase component 2
MTRDIYRRLARFLDDLPGGFPETESGVELRILRRLFTPAEAELAIRLNLFLEEASDIASRTDLPEKQVEERLRTMAHRGLIFSAEKEGRMKYMASQFVIGIWEFHLNDLDTGLVRDMQEYIPFLLQEAWKVPQLRTVPVNRSLSPQLEIMSYENAEKIIRHKRKIAVAPCICRKEMALRGHECDKPSEVCLTFDRGAEYYQRNGLGREITAEEAIDILRLADDDGLVLQPGNAREAGFICCCCGCCCAVLRTLKKVPNPASMISSAYRVEITDNTCSQCEICLDRCQMDALKLTDNGVAVKSDRCIGCGLCVTTCPTGTLALSRKPRSEQPKVPKNTIGTYVRLSQARGKFRPDKYVLSQIKSKANRLKNSPAT